MSSIHLTAPIPCRCFYKNRSRRMLRLLYESMPSDRSLAHTPAFINAAKRRHNALEQLIKRLSPEELSLLDELSAAEGELEDLHSFHKFCQGFRAGSALAIRQ